MKWKEFLQPNKEIAAILILTPLLMALLAMSLGIGYALGFVSTSIETNIIIGSILGPIPASLFIAASFLLKFKKELTYYLTFYVPYTVYEIIFPIVYGAVPIVQMLNGQVNSWPTLLMLLQPVISSLVFAPLFFLWLPRKLIGFGRYVSAFVSGLLYLVLAGYGFQIIISLLMYGTYNYTIQNIEIISDVVFVALVVLYSSLIYWKFKQMLKQK